MLTLFMLMVNRLFWRGELRDRYTLFATPTDPLD